MATKRPRVGTIEWVDLTVPDAKHVRDFYRKVVGWKASAFDMGGYDDYCMNLPGTGKTVAGICNAKGPNEGLPAQWLVYVTVADLAKSLATCRSLGGEAIAVRESKQGRFAVIRDPAGAVAALFEAPPVRRRRSPAARPRSRRSR
jgi:hypothetical protein